MSSVAEIESKMRVVFQTPLLVDFVCDGTIRVVEMVFISTGVDWI